LEDAPADVAEQLASYVEESSHARFTDMPGLRFKTWRIKPGQWFEGCYVFATDEDRSEFQRTSARPPRSRPARGSSAARRS
jgi:hypothetical protein